PLVSASDVLVFTTCVSSLTLILSLFLSFHCSAPHRHLHSFPTRRSSDLGTLAQAPPGRQGRDLPLVVLPEQGLPCARGGRQEGRSEEHTSELQSRFDLVCRLLLEKKKKNASHKYLVNTLPLDTITDILSG